MINMLKALMEKANNMENQINNFTRMLKTMRKNLMKIQKIKNVGAEIMNVINELISRLDIAEGRIRKSVNLKIGQKKLSN